MSNPTSPLAAAAHPDPNPYYAEMLAAHPLGWSEAGLWVVAGADRARETLSCPSLGVRPASEPVPAPLVGTVAGAVFARLVRMIDGPHHDQLKHAIAAALDSLDPTLVETTCREAATQLLPITPDHLNSYCFAVSAHAIGRLLGIAPEQLTETARLMGDFVRCFSPVSTPEQIAAGIAAALPLTELVTPALDGPLMRALKREFANAGIDSDADLAANALGFLFQSYEATAGLIGNAICRLTAGTANLEHLLLDTLEQSSPAQNTRRFAHAACSIAGHEINVGDPILILLAAANLDAASPDFSFGFGPHACPGRSLAMTIARIGIAELLESGFPLDQLHFTGTYRHSANTRIPLFATGSGESV
jgi:cytochrome P450